MYIDLSIPLFSTTPVYPGDPKIKITKTADIPDGPMLHQIELGTHSGTHIDAPAHMLQGGVSLGHTQLKRFFGRGVYISARDRDGGFSLDAVNRAGVQAGDIVIFDTGMADRLYDPAYFSDYPVMPTDIAEYLVNIGVSMVGLDTCSADNTDSFPVHKILLSGDVLIIENLTNVAALAGKDFKITALPLSVDLDGAPARVIAEVVESRP